MDSPLVFELWILMRTCSWWFRNPAKPRFLRRKSTRSFYLSLFSHLIWPAGSRVCVFLYSFTCNPVEHDNRRFISSWWQALEKFLLSLIFLSESFLFFRIRLMITLPREKSRLSLFFDFSIWTDEYRKWIMFASLVLPLGRELSSRQVSCTLLVIKSYICTCSSDSVTWYPIPT